MAAACGAPADPHNHILLSPCLVFQGRFADAVDVLCESFKSNVDDADLRDALVRTHVAWCESTPPDDIDRRLACLVAAIEIDPDPIALLELLGQQPCSSNQPAVTLMASNHLRDRLVRGQSPATVHLILGTGAAFDHDWETAKRHLRQAQELNPSTATVLNNLA